VQLKKTVVDNKQISGTFNYVIKTMGQLLSIPEMREDMRRLVGASMSFPLATNPYNGVSNALCSVRLQHVASMTPAARRRCRGRDAVALRQKEQRQLLLAHVANRLHRLDRQQSRQSGREGRQTRGVLRHVSPPPPTRPFSPPPPSRRLLNLCPDPLSPARPLRTSPRS
jgi:hypothetical protein